MYKKLSQEEWTKIADQLFKVKKEVETLTLLVGGRMPVKIQDHFIYKTHRSLEVARVMLEDRMWETTNFGSDIEYGIFDEYRFKRESSSQKKEM